MSFGLAKKKEGKNMKIKLITPILIFILLFTFNLPVLAKVKNNPSPTKPVEYTITIINTQGGTGSQKEIPNADGQLIMLIATPKNGYTFYKWRISGDYEIIKGTLKDTNLYIRLLSNCTAIPYYAHNKTNIIAKTKFNTNTSIISPKTAKAKDIPFIIILSVVTLIILVLVIFEVKRSLKIRIRIRRIKR